MDGFHRDRGRVPRRAFDGRSGELDRRRGDGSGRKLRGGRRARVGGRGVLSRRRVQRVRGVRPVSRRMHGPLARTHGRLRHDGGPADDRPHVDRQLGRRDRVRCRLLLLRRLHLDVALPGHRAAPCELHYLPTDWFLGGFDLRRRGHEEEKGATLLLLVLCLLP